MDTVMQPGSLIAFTAWLLLQILTEPHYAALGSNHADSEEDEEDPFSGLPGSLMGPLPDVHAQLSMGLNNFRLCTMFTVFEEEVGFWVRPRSTTWFSRFLLEEYDDHRWIQIFRMSKKSVFSLAELLRPHIQRQNTRYRLAIPVLIRVAVTLFKLTHGVGLILCSELFAIGKSTVSIILREVVCAINDSMRQEIPWPSGEKLRQCQTDFKRLCGLPAVVGAIDGTHVAISKPHRGPADYYYFKSGGYSINCQAVVDSNRRFLDLFLGMPGSTNDSRMLRRSSLHHLAMHNNLFDREGGVDGFSPYLIGDSGYPLLPWLMVPHRGPGQLSVAEQLFNKKLRRGRSVVENAFGILKQTFRELLVKTELHVTFLPDVIICCAILHNVLLAQSHEDVEHLLEVLRAEGLDGEIIDEDQQMLPGDAPIPNADDIHRVLGSEVRQQLGVYLTMQRQ